MNILTINAGSSSIKYKVFKIENDQPTATLSGLIEGIGEQEGHWHHNSFERIITPHSFSSHQQAFSALAERLRECIGNTKIHGVGHRVVHGGSKYFNPTLITADVLKEIIELIPLAPIHNPINAEGIQFALQQYPEAQQIALFDSGFHHTIPDYIHTYAIDHETASQYKIKRYGFHGLNHEYVSKQAAFFLKKPLNECHFISLHLGNGASACLIKQGKSYDTSMGMTPLAGLMMGSRCGDIDPAIPLYLQHQGMALKEVDALLNKKSGLIGIAKENDMRHLLTRLEARDPQAELAIAMYVYSIQKTIGSYLTQTSRLDALIFTGGIGENADPIRERIMTALHHLNFRIDSKQNKRKTEESCRDVSKHGIPILIIRGDEESFIAQEVNQLINNLSKTPKKENSTISFTIKT